MLYKLKISGYFILYHFLENTMRAEFYNLLNEIKASAEIFRRYL